MRSRTVRWINVDPMDVASNPIVAKEIFDLRHYAGSNSSLNSAFCTRIRQQALFMHQLNHAPAVEHDWPQVR